MSATLEKRLPVAVIGSGLVGRSWAVVFARAGYTVHLFDSVPKAAQEALPIISQVALDLQASGLLRKCQTAAELLARIHVKGTLQEALQGVHWTQECVPENIESKREVFAQMDQLASPGTTLASSTSGLRPSAFSSELKHRNRCLVAHPVNPPHLIPLVELVPSPFTDENIVKQARAFMEEIGQSPIVVKRELDGFILNRLQGAVLNEAFRLVEDGFVSTEDLDRTVKDGLGLRWCFMGPFETIDLNAPLGVKDYVERYSGNMYLLAQQQTEARKWQGAVVDEVVTARREMIPVDKLGERAKWRDARLQALIVHKMQQEQITKS